MSVPQLLEAMERALPPGSAAGLRWQASTKVRTAVAEHEVTLAARIDPQGRRREQYRCDGVRVDRTVLLRLTCSETECPQARAVREQWDRFHGRGARRAAAPLAQGLIEERPVSAGGLHCVARPARFPCHTRCPNGAHPPMVIDKSGWDLFDEGTCIAGGLTTEAGATRPRLRTLQEAEAFLLARWLFTRAALEALHKGP